MIDHDTARRLGATEIDFPLGTDEQSAYELHMRSCTACRAQAAGLRRDAAILRDLDLGSVPIDVRAHVAIAAEVTGRSGTGRWVLLAAAAILLIATIGASVLGGVGRDEQTAVGRPVHWTTPVVDLAATDLWIEAAGRRFVPPDQGVRVHSDAGDRSRWTLELTWLDGDVEMRINLYFASDGQRWWISEARTYDGRLQGDWLETQARLAEAPLGTVFGGDLVIPLEDRSGPNQGPGRLVIRGMRLSTNPGGGGPVDPNGGPILVPVPEITLAPSPAGTSIPDSS